MLTYKNVITSIFLSLFTLSSHAANEAVLEISSGIEYEEITKVQTVKDPSKAEVIEFFSYACPHCYNLEPDVIKWSEKKPDNVKFIQVPAIFNKQWEAFAGIYYTAEVLGVVEKVHPQVFEAIHGPGKKLGSLDDLKAIFVANGVAEKDFEATLNSFAVANMVRKAKAMTKSYGISSVPMVIVNGKFKTDSTLAHGHKNVFKVVDHIIKNEK